MNQIASPLWGEKLEKKGKGDIVFNAILASIVVFLVVFFGFNMICVVCSVDGPSMNYTLADKDTLLLERHVSNLKRGDIVTISGMSDSLIIKRVMGLEGDRLVFRIDPSDEEHVQLFRSVAGGEYKLLSELDYIDKAMRRDIGWFETDRERSFREEYRLADSFVGTEDFDQFAILVSEGECFVLGDNRNNSRDSRYYGMGRVENIEGKLLYRVKKDSILEKILLFIYREKKSEGIGNKYQTGTNIKYQI